MGRVHGAVLQGVLAAVAGRSRALQVVLAAHSARLKLAQQQLLKPQNAGGPGPSGVAQPSCSSVRCG